MTTAEKRAWWPFAQQVRDLPQVDPRVQAAINEAERLLAAFARPRKGPKRALPGESIKAKRTRKRETHANATRVIREAVMKRADGKCERCGCSETPWNALAMHHTFGGSGRRRQLQSVENCTAVCRVCHEEEHRASKR